MKKCEVIIISPPPIDASEFDARKDLSTVIVQFLCKNNDKGFSAKEIAQAVGLNEDEINRAMVKLGLIDFFGGIAGKLVLEGKKTKNMRARIEDVTVNGIIYYRCIKL